MKHVKKVSSRTPLMADACCDCQQRKVDAGKTGNVWDKCVQLGSCEGPSYVCVPDD